jgi:putative FmdB family regulatory protein
VKCGLRFEKIESLGASDTKKCPKCGAKAERQLSAPAIQFKGSGWYVTDYAGKKPDTGSSEKSGDSDSGKSEKSSDTKSTETPKSPESSKSEKGSKKKK